MRSQSFARRFAVLGLASAIMVGGAATSASGSSASSETSSNLTISSELSSRLDALGIDGETQKSLVAKWNAGDAWDSMSGGEVVSSETREIDGSSTIRTVFRDGSVSETSLETPREGSGTSIGVMSKPLAGCQSVPNLNGWVRRANCTADANYGVYKLKFTTDYSVKSGGGRIDRAFGASCDVVPPVSQKGCSLSINRKLNSGSVPATARLTAQFGGQWGGSITAWVQVEAYGSAWVTNN